MSVVQDTRRRGNGLKQKSVRVDTGRNIANMRIVKCWKLFSRECALALSQKVTKTYLDKALSNVVWPCFEGQEVG